MGVFVSHCPTLQKDVAAALIEKEHSARFGQKRAPGQPGYQQAVLDALCERWPELKPDLHKSDINNMKVAFWKGGWHTSLLHGLACTYAVATASFRRGLDCGCTGSIVPCNIASLLHVASLSLRMNTRHLMHAATNGKLPYEVEAAAVAAAAAMAAEEAAAARAAALSGIPGAGASWDEVWQLMEKAKADIKAGNMEEWLADGMLRGKQVGAVYNTWIQKAAKTAEQQQIIIDFWLDFKIACEKGGS